MLESAKAALKAIKNKQQRDLALQLATYEACLWDDGDISLLLIELEIEIGEGTNRFIYASERMHYCTYLAQNVFFCQKKSPEDILDKINWLWNTWEAISKATGKSWWNITEADKQKLSLMKDNQDQQLISRFRYYNECDRVFSYIREDQEITNLDQLSSEEANIYFN
ncbi:hypothetical protein BY458DRAFT_493302 [Sporodiniella umbellata]|nr:hypothetical protein BY458DRAFT_493302 [Sporodiniella umbellata]